MDLQGVLPRVRGLHDPDVGERQGARPGVGGDRHVAERRAEGIRAAHREAAERMAVRRPEEHDAADARAGPTAGVGIRCRPRSRSRRAPHGGRSAPSAPVPRRPPAPGTSSTRRRSAARLFGVAGPRHRGRQSYAPGSAVVRPTDGTGRRRSPHVPGGRRTRPRTACRIAWQAPSVETPPGDRRELSWRHERRPGVPRRSCGSASSSRTPPV